MYTGRMQRKSTIPILVAIMILTGCQSLPENPPETVDSVELDR